MPTFSHECTYQGYPCSAVQFRRSEGLAAESGFVEMDYKDFKKLTLKKQGVAWRGVDDEADKPGAVSIQLYHNLPHGGTRAEGPKQFSPPAEGFNLFGPLVLKTTGKDGGSSSEVRYEDIYVEHVEEIIPERANAQDHTRGKVRVWLTDLRRFYRSYGTVIQRINCRLRSGVYDQLTVKHGSKQLGRNGTPWSFKEVIRFLFGQLPGSPSVLFSSIKGTSSAEEAAPATKTFEPVQTPTRSVPMLPPEPPPELEEPGDQDFPPPEEIDAIGTPAVFVLNKLLDDYGLVAKMQPDGRYLVTRKGTPFLNPGEVADAISSKIPWPHVHDEHKSIDYVDVPSVLMVLGSRRVRRRTITCVPTFTDIDGKIYRLEDIDKVWEGYSIAQVNWQITGGSERNFNDVPPALVGRSLTEKQAQEVAAGERSVFEFALDAEDAKRSVEIANLHYRRVNIMRSDAYKMYAPTAHFGSNAPRNSKGAPYLVDGDYLPKDFLPMTNAPVFEKELKQIYPGMDRRRGDKGTLFLSPPIVRGVRVDKVFFTDFKVAAAHIKKVIASGEDWLKSYLRAAVRDARDKLGKVPEVWLRSTKAQGDRIIGSSAFMRDALDELLAEEAWGRSGPDMTTLIKKVIKDNEIFRIEDLGLELEILSIQHMVDTQNEITKKYKDELKKHEDQFIAEGGLYFYGNMPYDIIPQNKYSLDTTTGIIRFADLVCVLDKPVAFELNSTTVERDGYVSITFGRELNANEPGDFTSVLFAKKDGKIAVCGLNRGSPIKPHVVHDPDMVMYEDDIGFPMNSKACVEQAQRKAAPILGNDPEYEGFKTELSGFVKCVLERSVTSVQHEWDGSETGAFTHVLINTPGSVGPLGAGKTPRLIDVETPSNAIKKRIAEQP